MEQKQQLEKHKREMARMSIVTSSLQYRIYVVMVTVRDIYNKCPGTPRDIFFTPVWRETCDMVRRHENDNYSTKPANYIVDTDDLMPRLPDDYQHFVEDVYDANIEHHRQMKNELELAYTKLKRIYVFHGLLHIEFKTFLRDNARIIMRSGCERYRSILVNGGLPPRHPP